MSIEERAMDYAEKDANNNVPATQEPEKKEVVLVSTGDAIKSLGHNAWEQAKRFGRWVKPKAKKAAIAVAIAGGVGLAANEISKHVGKDVPESNGDDEYEPIDTVIQMNEDGSVVVTPLDESGADDSNETTE